VLRGVGLAAGFALIPPFAWPVLGSVLRNRIRMILVSWIRIRNPHSKCGLSYVKISAEFLITNTIINMM
jgi:hypothetical protein